MAGDFIRWEKGLTRKPEVLQVAAKLGLSAVTAAGHMMLLWEWADDATTDGYIPGATPQLTDAIAGFPGISEAMGATLPRPWLEFFAEGVRFPNYERHNGRCAKKRISDAERLRAWRKKQKGAPDETQ